jgi:Ca2+-binding RTX toxin-like protein
VHRTAHGGFDVATYTFSTLAHNQHLSFDPESDVLNFDSAGISASEVRIVRSGANLGFSHGGKTVWLDGLRLEDLDVANFGFADDSGMLFGDGSDNPRLDWYGAEYTLGDVTEDVQAWGLGGADVVTTGSGDDWLVGNVALTPLNHVSRSGSTGAPTASTHASVSADGNLVAFAGGWTAFGSTNNNGTDVFVKNMTSGTVGNEHRKENGENGASGSGAPVISADGSVVAFLSASDLTEDASDSGGLYDIFLAQVGGNGITMVSTGSGGTPAADGRSLNPDLSFDGSSIVFESTTSNWAAGGSTATTDVFLKDLATGTLTRVSTSTGGTDGNGESLNAQVSADGRYVVFESDANNLTAGDTNGYRDIFLWDRDAAGNKLTNLTEGVPARNPNNTATNADIAHDDGYGGVVVFQTARAFVDADTANNTDIYAYSLADGSFTLVSSTADGTGVQLSSEGASISGDGRFVVFSSYSDALVEGDANGTRDIFVKDLYTGRIALVSASATGEAGNGPSSNAQISLGGEWIVFESGASNLAASDANGTFSDVYRVSNPLLIDVLRGGAGNDTYVLARADTIRELAGGGTDTVLSSISYTLGANVENLTLTGSSNLSGTGNSLKNVITGNAGHNKLNGAGGIDTVSYADAGAAVTVSLAVTTAQVTGGAGSDTLSNFENLTGSAFNDRLTGNDGNNRIDGRAGGDTMIGGLGNDTYVVDANTDIITEGAGAGTDTVISAVNWTLLPTLENLTLSGSATNGTGNGAANVITGNAAANALRGASGNDTLVGGGGDDRLTGDSGNDRLDGGVGNDTLIGGTGDDTYVTDAAGDIVTEGAGAGTDTVISAVSWTLLPTLENLTLSGSATNGTGNSAANVITGNAVANTLRGGSGNDTISGGSGNDTLSGGSGTDALNGGGGADVYVLDSKIGSDTIAGFVSGVDDLRISRTGLPIGDGDATLERVATRSAPGGFANNAELVIFTANASALTTSGAAAVIGSATSAYATGATALFAVDNGSSSALYLFTSASANAIVSASELTLLATLSGTASTVVADYAFGT